MKKPIYKDKGLTIWTFNYRFTDNTSEMAWREYKEASYTGTIKDFKKNLKYCEETWEQKTWAIEKKHANADDYKFYKYLKKHALKNLTGVPI